MSEKSKPIHTTSGERAGEIAALALSAVPFVGGTLSELAKGVVVRRQSRRLNGFLANLAADMSSLHSRVNRILGESEDFDDFAERVVTAAEQTIHQEKLDAIRAVFLNTILSDAPDYERGLEILDLVLRLQSRHLVVLRILADPLKADKDAGEVVGRGGGISTTLDAILQRLLPKWTDEEIGRTWEGLRREELVQGQHLKAMITDRGIHQLEGRLSSFGQAVARYLINPAS